MKVYVSEELHSAIKQDGREVSQFYLTNLDSYYMIMDYSLCVTLRGNAVAVIPTIDLEYLARSMSKIFTQADFGNLQRYRKKSKSNYICDEHSIRHITNSTFEIAEIRLIFNALATALTENQLFLELPILVCGAGVLYNTPVMLYQIGDFIHYNSNRNKILIYKPLLHEILNTKRIPSTKYRSAFPISTYPEATELDSDIYFVVEDFRLTQERPLVRAHFEQTCTKCKFSFTVDSQPFVEPSEPLINQEEVKPLNALATTEYLLPNINPRLYAFTSRIPSIRFIASALITEFSRLLYLSCPNKSSEEIIRTIKKQLGLDVFIDVITYISSSGDTEDSYIENKRFYLNEVCEILGASIPIQIPDIIKYLSWELDSALIEDKTVESIRSAPIFYIDFNNLLSKLGVAPYSDTYCYLSSLLMYKVHDGITSYLVCQKNRPSDESVEIDIIRGIQRLNSMTKMDYKLYCEDYHDVRYADKVLYEKISYDENGIIDRLL